MPSEAQKKANKKYREKSKRILLEFYASELDLFNFVESQGKKQTYIKDLIRKDMKNANIEEGQIAE